MPSRRDLFKFAGAGALTASLGTHASAALAQQTQAAIASQLVTANRKLDIVNLALLEAQAKKVYTEAVYAFIAHGAGEQWTLRENRRAFNDFVFQLHRMSGTVRKDIDTSVTLLGERAAHPIIVTPMGSHGLSHAEGEVATARGAAMTGGIVSVSSSSTRSMEDIAAASTGPKWFQIYLNTDMGLSREQLQRARAAGFKAIILTVDAIAQGQSDDYIRLGRARPTLPYGNYPQGGQMAFKTDLSWKDVEFVRQASGLPVIVKGITRPQDAVRAIDAGASAIQVSNHGGRALDGTPAAITVLPAVVDALQDRLPVIFDSGIRRGTDVALALALGAKAVAIGRPVHYGLVLGGADGVASVIEHLRTSLVETLLHFGVQNLASVNRDYVARASYARFAPSE